MPTCPMCRERLQVRCVGAMLGIAMFSVIAVGVIVNATLKVMH